MKQSQSGGVSGWDAQPTKSQLCQTKPNLGRLEHVGEGGHRMRCGFAGKWNVRNKPNLPELVRVISACEGNGYGNLRRSVGREKQSQFRPTGPCESRSLGGSRRGRPTREKPVVRNKPNFRWPDTPIPLFHHLQILCLSCETDPISELQADIVARVSATVCRPHPRRPSGNAAN